jgi:hypothetical protein
MINPRTKKKEHKQSAVPLTCFKNGGCQEIYAKKGNCM